MRRSRYIGLCLVAMALLCGSCRTASQLAYTDSLRVDTLRKAYRDIRIGMNKPEIRAIIGEPNLILTPKMHGLNMRVDVWAYQVPYVNKKDGQTYQADVLELTFPYWESESPRAPLVEKQFTCPPQFIHEDDEAFWKTGHTTSPSSLRR